MAVRFLSLPRRIMVEGLDCQQFDDIMVYTFSNSSEAAIDAWGEQMSGWIDSLPPHQPFRVLIDVSSKQVSFSQPARQKSLELFTRYRRRTGRCAFLFTSRTAPYYSRIFFASLGRLEFQLSYFNDRDKALAWLRE